MVSEKKYMDFLKKTLLSDFLGVLCLTCYLFNRKMFDRSCERDMQQNVFEMNKGCVVLV